LKHKNKKIDVVLQVNRHSFR